ncbi:MAG: TldD/PmbA family protein [Pseudomonadota bacterium]|nr:TldD/PmbA family protein [Pseudomonadota bacterium]
MEAAERILQWITEAGATGDLMVAEGASLSLKARDGDLEEHKVSSSQVFGVRVIKDDKAGVAYSEASDNAALRLMVDQALINASYARRDMNEQVPDKAITLVTDDSLLAPTDDVSVEEKIDTVLRLERELAARDKVKNVPYNGVSDVTAAQRIFSTAGLKATSRVRACFSQAAALVEEGDKNVMEGWGQGARRFDELDIDNIVETAHANCLALLHGEAVPTKHYDVIFDAQCQPTMFSTFSMMFSGKAAKDGINPMRDKVGEAIADARLNLFDSPLLDEGFGYALFDDEGSPTARTPLIANGNLATLIHNSATASHFGLQTTGNGARSPRSTLEVQLHQFEIGSGEAEDDAITSGEYLELTDLTGTHSGANPVAGDFSFGASGFLCRDGERIQPVRNITVAGNFYEMLNKIGLIGQTRYWDMNRHAFMPRIRFSDVAISG